MLKKPTRPPSGAYAVGYGKPPKATQFKAGNQAARRQREKPKLDQINAMLEEALMELVPVKVNGRQIKMPAIKAIIVQARNRALQGEDKGVKQVLDFVERRGLAGPKKTDQDVFNAQFAGVRERLKEKLERRIAADERELEKKRKAEDQKKQDDKS